MIYECPHCHQKNRLPDALRSGGDYRCGKCRTVLAAPPVSVFPALRAWTLPKTRQAIAEMRPQTKRQVMLALANALYLALLVALLLMNAAGPDRWWFGSVNLYLPQWIWAAPAVLLVPTTLLLNRNWTWMPVLCLMLVLGPLMGLCAHIGLPDARASAVPSASQVHLRVMTYNVKWGEHDVFAVGRDIEKYHPDLLQLQDASGVLDGPLRIVLAGWNVRSNGQYLIASHLPITAFQTLYMSYGSAEHYCTRSTVQVGLHAVTVYDVHLISPRYGLYAVGSGQISGIIANTAERLQEARLVAADASLERGPTILTGDLNAPMQSLVCQNLIHMGLHDAFAEAGSGYGYTYGQYTRVKRPYVRIDHIFLSHDWRTQRVSVGNATGSEHCPVIADITLQQP